MADNNGRVTGRAREQSRAGQSTGEGASLARSWAAALEAKRLAASAAPVSVWTLAAEDAEGMARGLARLVIDGLSTGLLAPEAAGWMARLCLRSCREGERARDLAEMGHGGAQ